jgi:hypothetical protein
MAQKVLFLLVVGVFVATLAGLAAAEAPVGPMETSSSSSAVEQQSSDPELALGQVASWQAREPVETGAMPSKPGDSTDSCCANSGGPTLDENGFAVIRQGIDDGP